MTRLDLKSLEGGEDKGGATGEKLRECFGGGIKLKFPYGLCDVCDLATDFPSCNGRIERSLIDLSKHKPGKGYCAAVHERTCF